MSNNNKETVNNLDAPAGYPAKVKLFSGQTEKCAVYPMNGFDGPVRYAFIVKPNSMPYVRYSCFLVREPKPKNEVSGYNIVTPKDGQDYAQYFAFVPKKNKG